MANQPNPINIGNLTKNILKADTQDNEFDLDNWIRDFEDGFPNYEKINPSLKLNYWGQTYGKHPKIRELNHEPDAQQNEGYRVIEFLPNRDDPEEAYLLFGTPIALMAQLSTLMNTRRMLDIHVEQVGAWVGYPVDEYLRAKPRQELTVQVILTNKKDPPFYKNSNKWFTKRQVTIPAVDKSKLTFKAIRAACGDAAGQDWGEWSARAYVSLDDDAKGIHQMVAGGSTKEKATANLEKFLPFTKCKLRGMSCTQIDYTKGDRAKDPTRAKYNSFNVYPAWISVLNSKLIQLDDLRGDGKNTLSGKMLTKQNRLWTYMDVKPTWWDTRLQELTNHVFS